MPTPPPLCTYDYAIVRVVPRVERGEFVNVGAIVSCADTGFLQACIELDEARLRALDPMLDIEPIRDALGAIPVLCTGGAQAGPIGLLPPRRRFHWLVAPRSAAVQTSPVHSGRCRDPRLALEELVARAVRIGRPTGSLVTRPRMALIAHDHKKAAMVALAREFQDFLEECALCATGNTGARLEAEVGLTVERLLSGPLGGDLQIGARLAAGQVDAVVFLRDPMTPQPHEPDINALVRACDVHDVPCATNVASARVLLERLQATASRQPAV